MFKKLKLHLFFLSVVVLLSSLVMPAILVEAGSPPSPTILNQETLGNGKYRIDPYSVSQLNSEYLGEDGNWYQEWTTTINSLPETFGDLSTKIICDWTKNSEGYEALGNLFYAKVTGTRVSVENNGVLSAWDPSVYVGNTKLELVDGPKVVKDPYNDNYKRNTIEWTYQRPNSFWDNLVGKDPLVVTRYLRQIEGLIFEYYIINTNPGGDLTIVNNYLEEDGFSWETDIFAYDSNYKPLVVSGTKDRKVVKGVEFSNPLVKYPVLVDPSIYVTGSTKDGFLYYYDTTYSTARTASSSIGGFIGQGDITMIVGQKNSSSNYFIYRSYLYFDTSSLPDNAQISSASILLYGSNKDVDSPLTSKLQLQTGGGTYPSDPLAASNFNYSYYSGSGFEDGYWLDYVGTSGYNSYSLSPTGLGWISKTGWSKFVLRTSEDIAGTASDVGEEEKVAFWQAEHGSGYAPKFSITYTIPITKPVITTMVPQSITASSAYLRGYLSNDGGADCNVWFGYSTDTSYAFTTTPLNGYNSGDTWGTSVYGLSAGTLYHYTAKAQNSGGTSDSNDETFVTCPTPVTNFSATPGNEEVAFTWTKGSGSLTVYTMIRRSTSGFPTSPTSGTQVYFDTGASTTDTGLTNGTTYYYSAWSYVSSGGDSNYSVTKVQASGMPYTSGPPVAVTYAASSIESDSAILNGALTALNGEASATMSFVWDELGGGFSNETTTTVLSQPDSFYKAISGLTPSTTYEVKTKATNGQGTAYGDVITFTTGDPSPPTMTTQSATGVVGTSATLWGIVTDDGGATVTAWFEWGLDSNYGETTDSAAGLFTGDQLYETLIGLEPSTTYHFRVVGQNDEGTSYGSDAEFTTDTPEDPEVTTVAATNIGASTATVNGFLDSDGGDDTSVRFLIGTDSSISLNVTTTGWQEGKTTGDSFNYYATNMSIETTYYFKAQALNGSGVTINGTVLSFTTIFSAPTSFSAIPLSSSSVSLSWVPQSDKTLIIYKEGSYPADRLDGSQAYFGSGSSATVEGLDPGTTYFFRAWSWRDGDNYSTSYAEDAATTTSGGALGEIDYSAANMTVADAPTWWFQSPSSESISTWPGVSFVDGIADSWGMPRSTLWVIVITVLSILVGLVVGIVLPMAWAVLIVGACFLSLMSSMGAFPGYILIPYLIIGGAVIILLPNQGGATSG